MRILALSALLVSAACLNASGPKNSFYPPSFPSREAAEQAAHGLFAGGDVDVLRVRNKEVLIFIVHGSGLPDIGIAAYFRTNGAWQYAADFRPSPDEFHKAKVSGNAIVIVGEHTKKEWPFLKLD